MQCDTRRCLTVLRLSLRTLLAHKGRFAMTTFAVVVGVGFVVGSFVVTDTLRRSVDELFESTTTVDATVSNDIASPFETWSRGSFD